MNLLRSLFGDWGKRTQRPSASLKALLKEAMRLTSMIDMPRRIELCQAALIQIELVQNPRLWAGIQVELGNSLLQNLQGDRSENLEGAIECYEQALLVMTREAMSVDWAVTTMNLANAYLHRIRGERAENLERAIEYCEQALLVMTRQAMPIKWAVTTMNLANAYSDRIRGEQAENLERAIEYYEQALLVMTRQAMPIEWATTTMNLANAYSDRIRGEQAENLERAIEYYEQALLVMTRQAMPIEWAATTMNLALAYLRRICGERAENLERAIEHCEQALLVMTRQAMPIEWATTTINLATTYKNRIRGERAENLERAIEYYEQALLVMTRQAMPIEWATTTMNLANAYSDRIRGERAENLEQAIEYYEQALLVMTRQAMPIEWAATTMNLALAYTNRIHGERAENLERAIECSEQALLVITRQAMPIKWAQITMNLAITYIERIRGERAENLERAITTCQQALLVMTREAMPVVWARNTMNLANAYLHRIRGERAENLEQAIEYYEQALLVRTQQAMPVEWALTTMNLANAYLHRIRGERAENLERAIEYYEQALLVRTQQAMPVEWAATTMNLALAYTNRIRGERTENLERAIELHAQALEIYTPEMFLDDHLRVQESLGTLYFQQGHWLAAASAFEAVLQASEKLYLAAATPEARQSELGKLQGVPLQLAYTMLKTSARDTTVCQDAVLVLERNRARWLSESLALRTAKPASVSDALWQRFVSLGQQIQTFQAESRLSEEILAKRSYLVLTELLRTAYEQLDETIDQIRIIAPDFMPQPSFADIQAAAQAAPLIYLLTTEVGGLALIVQVDKVTPVWLDGVTEEKLHKHINAWFNAYDRQRTARQTGLDTQERITHALWDAVMGPVAEMLHDLIAHSTDVVPSVILIPTGLLSLLPLHATWSPQEPHPSPSHGEGTVTGTRRYFLDEFVVNYAPSARALTHAATTARQVTGAQLLAVNEPRPVRGNVLPNSGAEVAAITDHFAHAHLFAHEQAKRADVLAALPQAQVVHFSCHGGNDWRNPLESGLLMAHDEMLTVRDLLELQLPGARLATLSACETGIVGTDLPDEVVDLPSALVQAGFAGVVASLWSVADVSTAMLMARFYAFWQQDKLEPAQALRAAQRWVRDTTNREKADYFGQEMLAASGAIRMPEMVAADFLSTVMLNDADDRSFAHPYWWAAFYLTGV